MHCWATSFVMGKVFVQYERADDLCNPSGWNPSLHTSWEWWRLMTSETASTAKRRMQLPLYKMVSNNERVVSTGFAWCAIDSNKSHRGAIVLSAPFTRKLKSGNSFNSVIIYSLLMLFWTFVFQWDTKDFFLLLQEALNRNSSFEASKRTKKIIKEYQGFPNWEAGTP